MDGRGKTGVIDRVPATVHDHRLAFNMRMFPPLEPAMASIEPAVGHACEGALYTLTAEGYEELWRSEGGSMRRPGYEEQVVTAEVLGAVRVQAVTLRAAPWMRLQRDAPPSARYKRLIVDGAREVGLSESYQYALAGLPASAPSAALTALARAHGVVAVLLFRLRLRALLWPLRAASYALLDATRLAKRLLEGTSGGGSGLGSDILDGLAEIATGALLLPTAALGALIRLALRLCGKEKLVQFGPPPSKPAAPPSR